MTPTTITFADPTRVVIEASWATIVEQNLDTFEGEQYDAVDDVIRITWHRDEVEIVTCRTIERPARPTIVIPRAAVERVIY